MTVSRSFLIVLMLLLAAYSARAQVPGTGGSGNGQPFTIDADESLEYRQADRVYIAKGRAKVTRPTSQGGATVTADTLTAYERDKAGGKTESKAKSAKGGAPMMSAGGSGNSEIWKFEGEGNVVIDNGNADQPSRAYGDHATYDIDTQRAVLTGRNLHLDSGEDRITARDNFEYFTDRHEAIANGDAKAVQPATADNPATRTVTADTLHVFFTQDAAGSNGGGLTADHTEAKGHVHVTTVTVSNGQTQTSTATSDSAHFDNKGNTATLTGNVKIARGPNLLEGARAEIDMKTGVSRLLAAPAAPGQPKTRIRGLLLPGNNTGSSLVAMPATKQAQP